MALLGDQFEVECTIEAYPRANNLWLKKLERTLNVPQKSRALISTNSNKLSNLAIGFDNFLQPNSLNIVRQKQQSIHRNSSIEQNLLESQRNSSNFKLINQPILENTNAHPREMSESFYEREILPILNSTTTTTVRQTVINSYTYKLKLAIAKVTQEDYGEYTCVSINPLGNSTTNFILLSEFRTISKNDFIQLDCLSPTNNPLIYNNNNNHTIEAHNEVSKLSETTSNDPRQKHQVEGNETNSHLQDVKISPKSGNLLQQKTSIRRTGNQVYGRFCE